ncbi:hypothetical protein [Enterococcus rivorum]
MSGDWINAVTMNEVANQYDQWQMQKQMMQALTQKDYIDITAITTYKEALEAGIRVEVFERELHEIALDSPIKEIRYNGERVIPGEYVLKGTPLTATISPRYEATSLQTTETTSTAVEKETGNTTTTQATIDTTTTTSSSDR